MTLAQQHLSPSPDHAYSSLDLWDAWADARAQARDTYDDWSSADRTSRADAFARYAAAAEREDAAAALFGQVAARAATAAA